jgi:hypothetical protein
MNLIKLLKLLISLAVLAGLSFAVYRHAKLKKSAEVKIQYIV